MLKFVTDNMASIDGIEIYPIISLVIFVAFFTGMLVKVLKIDKNKIHELENLPLKED